MCRVGGREEHQCSDDATLDIEEGIGMINGSDLEDLHEGGVGGTDNIANVQPLPML